jgi:hypothetical protein
MPASLLRFSGTTIVVESRGVIARLVLWSLADSKTTVDELRRVVRDEVAPEVDTIPGLRLKAWLSDESGERWGSLELWESPELADPAVHGRERELIGKDPEVGEEFELEASAGDLALDD